MKIYKHYPYGGNKTKQTGDWKLTKTITMLVNTPIIAYLVGFISGLLISK